MQRPGTLTCLLVAIWLVALPLQPGWTDTACDQVYAQQAKKIRQKYAKFVDEAHLTPDQKQRLQSIRQTTDQQIEGITKTIVEKQRDLMQYLFTPGTSQAIAEQRTEEISQLRGQIAHLKLNALLQAREVMTAEQRQEFAALHQQLMTTLANRYPACLQPLSSGALD